MMSSLPAKKKPRAEPQPQQAARITTLPTEGIFVRRLLSRGFLTCAIGMLAATCRYFGGRRAHGLWGLRAGLSLCEAAIRLAYHTLPIPGCAFVEMPVWRSAGRALLSRTFATPGLQIKDGVLEGWDESRATAVVIPHGVTSIAASAFKRCTDQTLH